MDIPTTEPQFIQAGDTLKWTRQVDGYSAADGWSLSYRVINAASKFDIPTQTDVDGIGFAVNVPASTTTNYAAGVYRWVARVTCGVESYTVGQGEFTVLADLVDASAAVDTRSQNERILDAINGLIEGRFNSDTAGIQQYKIGSAEGGREIVKMTLDELLGARAKYTDIVAREKSALGIKPRRRMVVPLFRSRT